MELIRKNIWLIVYYSRINARRYQQRQSYKKNVYNNQANFTFILKKLPFVHLDRAKFHFSDPFFRILHFVNPKFNHKDTTKVLGLPLKSHLSHFQFSTSYTFSSSVPFALSGNFSSFAPFFFISTSQQVCRSRYHNSNTQRPYPLSISSIHLNGTFQYTYNLVGNHIIPYLQAQNKWCS